jgi:sialate O-acetylesterase
VWLATGQSNMHRPVSSLPDVETVLATIDQPHIRHINIAPTIADEPAESVETSGWLNASPETAADFSAIAWFFSEQIFSKLGVPVGIIHSSWGGSSIEAWLDETTMQSTTAWPAIKQRWDHLIENFDTIKTEWETWVKAEEDARENEQPNDLPRPLMPLGPGTQRQLSGLFNGMLAPLQPYAIRGNLWYQGEANWDRPAEYAELFSAMIKAWREQWGQGDFPFYFVQLPNYTDERDPAGNAWPWIRDAQASALALPHTAMAVTIDCGDNNDIHPQNKPIVGDRLARLAADHVYAIECESSGPVFKSAEREGATLRVHFDHAHSGLILKGDTPPSFELAGIDRKFHPATATIDGQTIIVHSPDVSEPVAVRYAWNNIPIANIYNEADLPAAPFRSDDW